MAAADGGSNAQIARDLGLHVDTVRAEIKALACALPAEHGLPLSRWSCSDLAREARGSTAAVSGSTVRRWVDAEAIKPWQHRS